VGAVRKELMTQKVDAVVVTTLDEIAWLLNVRGSDVANSPLVEGYVFLSLDRIVLFIQPEKVTGTIREHLNSDRCQEEPICVECVGLIIQTTETRWAFRLFADPNFGLFGIPF
jgi:Xaa-Pro aminopeptidase